MNVSRRLINPDAYSTDLGSKPIVGTNSKSIPEVRRVSMLA